MMISFSPIEERNSEKINKTFKYFKTHFHSYPLIIAIIVPKINFTSNQNDALEMYS